MQKREMSEAEQASITDTEFKSCYFPVEFRNYVEAKKLSCRKLTCNNYGKSRWIFWSPKNELHEIINLLENMTIMKKSLVQFWSASKVDSGRQLLLTTRDQPFVITVPEDKASFSKELCSYRTNISEYDIKTSIKAEEKEDVGVVGRVFQNQRIEFTPNVSYYSSKDYPQRELALYCRIRSCVAFPLSDSNGHPIGAIEMVSQSELDSKFWTHLQEIISSDYLKKRGLTCMRLCQGPCERYGIEDALIRNSISEIHEVLKGVMTSHGLVLAQTWILCRSCNVLSVVGSVDCRFESFLKSGFNSQSKFVMAQHFCHLQKGEGVVGKTLLSHGLVYCENVAEFSISEYPLAHFARHDNLSACFAIFLHSTITRNQVYVLELFLGPRNFNDVKTTVVSILESLMHNFSSFKVVSRDELGDNLSMDAVDERFSYKKETIEMRVDSIDNRINGVSTTIKRDIAIILLENQHYNKTETLRHNQSGKSPIEVIDSELSLQPISEVDAVGKSPIEVADSEFSLQPISAMDAADTEDLVLANSEVDAVDTENLVPAVSEECVINSSNRLSRKGGIPISFEELEKVSGMKRKEAATKLNVSVSTLKRVCREYEISRWPPRKKIMDNQFPSKKSVESASLNVALSGCASSIIQAESHEKVNAKSGCASSIVKDERRVTVKAKYGDNFIKFQLSACSRIDEFNQQVFKRLKLDAGTYIIKYQDEDNDWILIACDEDLQGYISSAIALEKNTLILSLESIA